MIRNGNSLLRQKFPTLSARVTVLMLHDFNLALPGGFSSAGNTLDDGFFSQGPLTDAWLRGGVAPTLHDAEVIAFTISGPVGGCVTRNNRAG
jgi:hypothetical protein